MKTKNESIRLDDLDWRILKALQDDARQTYTEIGHNLGLAHSTIYDRIKRMEKQGIIKKYTTIFDLQKIGVPNGGGSARAPRAVFRARAEKFERTR